jgi:hypothetical protein
MCAILILLRDLELTWMGTGWLNYKKFWRFASSYEIDCVRLVSLVLSECGRSQLDWRFNLAGR